MNKKPSWFKGLIAGALGGALGTVVLNLVQKVSLDGTRRVEDLLETHRDYSAQQEQLLKMFMGAHVATAKSLGFRVTDGNREEIAMNVEFAFGILCGALYGVLAEYEPAATAGHGGLYGAVLFTGASEVVLPAIGFVPSPIARTFVQHAGGLTGNVMYGLTTEAVRRLIRAA